MDMYTGILTGYARLLQLEIKSGDDDLIPTAEAQTPPHHSPPNDAIVDDSLLMS